MRIISYVVLLAGLGGCGSQGALEKELAALRTRNAELEKAAGDFKTQNQKLDRDVEKQTANVEALEKELSGLKTRPEPPPLFMATGGALDKQTDLCWVLTRVKPADGPERTVLALYRARQRGEYFDLQDVRMIDADLRFLDMRVAWHKREGTDVDSILRALPEEERKALEKK